jgi:hypothetical protein
MRLFERVRSHRSLITKSLVGLGVAAGLTVAAAAPAQAEYWRHGGYGYRYYPRPYVYVAPAPVYYAPPPVYYAPPPPVYYPAPAYYAPAYYAPRPFIGVGIGLPPLVFRIH